MKDVFLEHRTHLFIAMLLTGLIAHALSIRDMNVFAIILIIITIAMWIVTALSMALDLYIRNKEDNKYE